MPVKLGKDGHLLTPPATPTESTAKVEGSVVVVQPTAQIHHQHTKDKGKTLISESMQYEKVGSEVTVEAPYAEIEYQCGRVFGDGNFGSFRVGVSLRMPCAPQFHSIEEAYVFAHDYTNTKLIEELKGTPVEGNELMSGAKK